MASNLDGWYIYHAETKMKGWSDPRAWTIRCTGSLPNVPSSSQPIVRPRGRGSLPRLPLGRWFLALATGALFAAALQIEKAAADGERKTVEADLGPVRHLATLIGADSEGVLPWFILVIAILLDPAAALLLLCAVERRDH
jgi:hypothetical protein